MVQIQQLSTDGLTVPVTDSFTGYIQWHQTQTSSVDVYECKRYAVALKENDLLIGVVGMGLEDTVNEASCKVAKKAGFELFEKRTPIGHVQPNMVSDSYFYFRKYR